MIQKAQPKEGLETGGLISGSEAARARIAAEYEPDLSGANGPAARFDTLRELINTEIGAALNEMTFASGDGSQIFGRDGKFAVNQPTAKRAGAGVAEAAGSRSEEPWDLIPAADGLWDLVPGSLSYAGRDVNFSIALTGTTGLSLAASRVLFIEIESALPTTAEVKIAVTWPEFPSPYEYEYDGDTYTHTLVGYRFPLWQFFAENPGGPGVRSFGSVFGKKLCPSDLRLGYGIWEKRNAGTGVIEIPPVGAPFFQLAPAAMIEP